MSRPTHQPIALEVPEVAGKRVTVMGLGQFGGGVGVTKYLVARGARVPIAPVPTVGRPDPDPSTTHASGSGAVPS